MSTSSEHESVETVKEDEASRPVSWSPAAESETLIRPKFSRELIEKRPTLTLKKKSTEVSP